MIIWRWSLPFLPRKFERYQHPLLLKNLQGCEHSHEHWSGRKIDDRQLLRKCSLNANVRNSKIYLFGQNPLQVSIFNFASNRKGIKPTVQWVDILSNWVFLYPNIQFFTWFQWNSFLALQYMKKRPTMSKIKCSPSKTISTHCAGLLTFLLEWHVSLV